MTERIPVIPITAVVAFAAAVAMMFLYAPTEALQGNVQRIFYIHAPAALVAYIGFITAAACSVLVLARRQDWARWDRIAVSAAELGVLFTTIVLVTGPIWGRRVWGVWWVWDARLTSTLVLWLIYVGYLVFRSQAPPGERRARLAAVIAIIGVVDIPVVHFAVTWWRTLHPLPTVLRPGGPDLPGAMVLTFLVSFVALTLVFATLLSVRIRLEESRHRLNAATEREALRV